MQISIFDDGSSHSVLTERLGFRDSVMPLLGGEVTLPYAHQRIKLLPRYRR
jgi:hypothetical protein